jgi:DNA-binding XRE family transcriptional regulator
VIHSVLAQMLGVYILEERLEKNINQKSLAAQVGCSEQFMGRIEKGCVMPPEWILINCITVLDLNFNKLRKIYRISSDAHLDKLYKQISRNRKASGD